MTVNPAAERHKKHFDEYLELFEQAEAARDVKGMRHNLKKAIDYWFKYSECADSPAIKASRLDNLEALMGLLESLPESQDDLDEATENGKDGAAASRGKSRSVEGGKEEDRKFAAVERPKLRFDDIAGLESVKEEVRLKMLYPFRHPEEAKRFRIKRGGGVLLWGPPGTGKTMMAKAIAGEIEAALLYGQALGDHVEVGR